MSDASPPREEPMIAAISRDDPGMKTAYRRASETLSDFISHIAVDDGRFCSAKLCFKDPDSSEELGENQLLYWWLDFAAYDPDERMFSAEFTELPACLEPYHQIGERLWFEGEDIFDWRVNADGKLFGGFTIRVARAQLPDGERADYDRYIGVTEYLDTTAP